MSPPSQRRLVVACAFIAAGAGVILFTKQLASHAPPLPELHLTNLVQRGDRWLVAGTTNAFTGLLLDTYEDGSKKSRSAVSNGLLNGPSFGWHTNAQLQVEEHFVAGNSHGLRTKWHPNGRKLSEANVVEGRFQGVFRRWHDNGAIAEEMELKDGKPDGVSRAYYPSGFAKSRATLRGGRMVEQIFWNDGEHREPAEPDLVSGK